MICPRCKGKTVVLGGHIHSLQWMPCPLCSGAGVVRKPPPGDVSLAPPSPNGQAKRSGKKKKR